MAALMRFEAHPAALTVSAPATARDFDVPQRETHAADTCSDMTDFRPHQPTTYDIRDDRRPVRTVSSPSPSGPPADCESAKRKRA